MIDLKVFRNHVIDIKLPVAQEYTAVLRLFVAGIGNLWGMTLDEIDDLKLTITEAFLDIVDRSKDTGGLISVRWRVHSDRAIMTLTDPSRSIRKIAQSPVLALLAESGKEIEIVEVAGENRIELGFNLRLINDDSVIRDN
jgi:anti-sigma regulatory factor (Ser/Thr protein kinase)